MDKVDMKYMINAIMHNNSTELLKTEKLEELINMGQKKALNMLAHLEIDGKLLNYFNESAPQYVFFDRFEHKYDVMKFKFIDDIQSIWKRL